MKTRREIIEIEQDSGVHGKYASMASSQGYSVTTNFELAVLCIHGYNGFGMTHGEVAAAFNSIRDDFGAREVTPFEKNLLTLKGYDILEMTDKDIDIALRLIRTNFPARRNCLSAHIWIPPTFDFQTWFSNNTFTGFLS